MERGEAERIVASAMTVSDKIRALAGAGHPRAEIARLLGKRYQHVRNVLEADKLRLGTRPAGAEPYATGVAAPPPRYQATMLPDVEERSGGTYRLAVRADGSVVLPAAVREAFGIDLPGVVMARLEGDEFKIISIATAWRRIDELLAPYKWKGGPMASDELIAERRDEAERE
ncbi:AbrB/MazE/SpoVT family DNA-binding domain-containing protein [uncultured Phenylobacterium sp.]|uniref:AbrB/MazE/SpoVT family DNA-binding domain-containing protein n=1 Tax=uncultured Phenylobacterium sp. TaxID=349273 RepID=UPI0025CB9ED9|nr:AbrB/MazE/SpoVT family DNA-binding domain-containing protein [uncultured Phenylobacterium sp.]